MKKIPFTIEIRSKIYTGHLSINDLSQPPRNYLVFVENHMAGELMWRHKWTFSQGRRHKILGNLTNSECEDIALYLSEIVSLAYEKK